MPIYEYVCMECESHFEELVRNGEAIHCPDCEASNVRKQLSVFATHGTAEQPSFGGPSGGGGCCGQEFAAGGESVRIHGEPGVRGGASCQRATRVRRRTSRGQ